MDKIIRHRLIFLALFITVIFSSCDKKPMTEEVTIPSKLKSVVLIGNEGNFQFGNASLTVVNISENVTYDDVFKNVNGRKLGDVLQSISVKDGLVYLVVNNSQKIEIINRSDFKSVATFTGFSSPRYIEFATPQKAYVSEYYTDQLKVVNMATHQITGTIGCGGWQEELRIVNNKLYVASFKSDKIYVINTFTDQVIDSIKVSIQPTSLCVDKLNRLWVGCNGDNHTNAFLYCINTEADSVEKSFMLPNNLIRKVVTNGSRDFIWFLSDHVYKIGIDETAMPSTPFIPSSGNNFYSIGIDSTTNEIYVSDAIDYIQKSTIIRYNSSNGQFLGQFKAGLISSSFYFDHEQ